MNVAIMCNTKSSEYPNRPELIDDFLKKGDVVFFAAIDDGTINNYYNGDKAEFLPILASRNNINPFIEIMSLFDIRRKVKENNLEAVVIYGVKNHPAMAIGSWLGGAKKIICVVNGRGNLFVFRGVKGLILRLISFPMLKIAYMCSNYICFQNEDDGSFFVKNHLVNSKKVQYTDGSGVNTKLFPAYKIPNENEFLYLARITPSKGLKEYIEAARIVKQKYPKSNFHVVGPIDSLIEGSLSNIINHAVLEGIIKYHGKTNDVRGWLRKTRYFVYPSYYPEGVPRCVLQALSCGRPIITCDSPGCRSTVIEGVNGFLVKPRDINELVEKMITLIENNEIIEEMGVQSRKLAELKFEISIINKKIISLVHS
ncbi:glycosyltransferase family 4 protein [[Clostridium] spiroforme]|nr:glycosyltransferase family 4 protein [Thomasclavelia spiroformis]